MSEIGQRFLLSAQTKFEPWPHYCRGHLNTSSWLANIQTSQSIYHQHSETNNNHMKLPTSGHCCSEYDIVHSCPDWALFLHSARSFNYAHPLRQNGWYLILLNKIKRRLVLWRHHKAVRGSFYCGDKPVSEPLCCPIKHQTASEVGRQFQRSVYRWRSYAEAPGSMLGRGTPWYLISTAFSRYRSKARSEWPALRFRYPLDEPQLCGKQGSPDTHYSTSIRYNKQINTITQPRHSLQRTSRRVPPSCNKVPYFRLYTTEDTH